ncbi:hypothetical protein Ait01nite_015330 [Actinoplanes italicus]|uniref:Uncharacterized protein n=1 Tax=Actinoplanes italicus TaxID=113567 RepID=A0A2T0KI96_9ACTN|nr:hypothetical protein [Actinoplanes italicus]PRX22967.1 hypothetical protein CLV67_104495 [Actinoplanes italicus]GIE28488.1 hypothetical protein Ait01nite_015330 [Actinoplanes italicus]
MIDRTSTKVVPGTYVTYYGEITLTVRIGRLRAAFAALLAIVATLATLGTATPAQAVYPANGWYMLVNDYYDGFNDYTYCLSTNGTDVGSNTHAVYLARCNAATPAQWWYSQNTSRTGLDDKYLVNYQNFGNKVWELSQNGSKAYTAQVSDSSTHEWDLGDSATTNGRRLVQAWSGSQPSLSASHNNPNIAGTFNVYVTDGATVAQHFWRFERLGTRPTCSPCGAAR